MHVVAEKDNLIILSIFFSFKGLLGIPRGDTAMRKFVHCGNREAAVRRWGTGPYADDVKCHAGYPSLRGMAKVVARVFCKRIPNLPILNLGANFVKTAHRPDSVVEPDAVDGPLAGWAKYLDMNKRIEPHSSLGEHVRPIP